MRTIVAGGRDFNDYGFLKETLDALDPPCTSIISGAARGADSLGEIYAFYTKTPLVKMPADWERWGKSAGYKRNVQMSLVADRLVAFWDGQSSGTRHMIKIATDRGLVVHVVRYPRA